MVTPQSYTNIGKAQQHADELQAFLQFVRANNVKSYCEIGCKFGGLLWQVAQVLPKKARVVAVDMPNQAWGRTGSQESLQNCIEALRKLDYDAHLFLGDSTSDGIVERVKALSPFDLLFIDANHTEKYVRKDFGNYGTLASIVCFHDIGWNNPTPPGRLPIEVPKVWADIKKVYEFAATFEEIKRDNGHNGIGIMRWA
jgi:methyltransferase family protein